MQTELCRIFENSFTSIEDCVSRILVPVFHRNKFERAGCGIPEHRHDVENRAESRHVRSVYHVGTVDICAQKVNIFEIVLADFSDMRRDCAHIHRVVGSFLDMEDTALMIVHYATPEGRSWQFSYVEKNRTAKDLVSAKRWSYFCGHGGSGRIAAERLARFAAIRKVQTGDLKEVFSVRALTSAFYTKLYDWYEWAQDEGFNVIFPDCAGTGQDGESMRHESFIRLIMRLIFVWFAKQNHLVDDALFDVQKLALYLKNFDPKAGQSGDGCSPPCEETTNYYRAILQNLFFDTLNTPMGERRFAEDEERSGSSQAEGEFKTFFHDEDLLTKSGRIEVKKCFAHTPFIDSGLFERPGEFGGRDERMEGHGVSRAFVPNILFFNDDERHPGIFTLFKQYPFVVEESTPDDIIIALDPEIMGIVFENLLASYRPDVRDSARKTTGSFYTPREIVEYMAASSLCEYVKHKLAARDEIAPELVDRLFREEACPEELNLYKNKIRHILCEARILDPACGAGAFPMGVMQCVLNIMRKLGFEGDGVIYEIKKHIIDNCLYGIDIQSLAVQMTRLRFFLSLVFDIAPDQTKPNLGMPSCAGLLAHFVAANAIMPLHVHVNTNTSWIECTMREVQQEKIHLRRIHDEYFRAAGSAEKRKLLGEERNARARMAVLLRQHTIVDRVDVERFLRWNPCRQNSSNAFFDPDWMFGISDGFDIVIGNPPYGVSMSREERKQYRNYYKYLLLKYDIYMVFFEMGLNYTKDILCYITPDKWLSRSFALEFRKHCMMPHMFRIVYTKDKVFENATVDAIISFFAKQSSSELEIHAIDQNEGRHITTIDKKRITDPFFVDQYFIDSSGIVEWLERQPFRVKSFAKCEYALVSPSLAYQLKNVIGCNPEPGREEFLILNTGLIAKYRHRWNDKHMRYLKSLYPHPVVSTENLRSLMGQTFVTRMASPKLIIKGLNLLDCTVDLHGRMMSTVATLNIRSASTDLLCLLGAIINSSLMGRYCKEKYVSSSYCGGLEFTPQMIESLPVPDLHEANSSLMTRIVENVKKILTVDEEKQVCDLIQKTDEMVSRLYHVTSTDGFDAGMACRNLPDVSQ